MDDQLRQERKTPIGSHRPHIDPLSNVPVGVRSFFSLISNIITQVLFAF